jgi:hypothetical protein
MGMSFAIGWTRSWKSEELPTTATVHSASAASYRIA